MTTMVGVNADHVRDCSLRRSDRPVRPAADDDLRLVLQPNDYLRNQVRLHDAVGSTSIRDEISNEPSQQNVLTHVQVARSV
jgi:hypothetical protein